MALEVALYWDENGHEHAVKNMADAEIARAKGWKPFPPGPSAPPVAAPVVEEALVDAPAQETAPEPPVKKRK